MSDEKSFSVCQEMLQLFRAVLKLEIVNKGLSCLIVCYAYNDSVLLSIRQYCARRLARLRHSLHFALGSRHGYKGKKLTKEMINSVR